MPIFKTDEQRAQAADAKQAEWDAKYVTRRATAPVTTWEYKHYLFGTGTENRQIERALNLLGKQGWELVSMDVERNQRIMGAPASTTIVVKRRTS